MASGKDAKAKEKEPKPKKKIGPIKKGALIGATAGTILALGVHYQTAIREGHAAEALARVRAEERGLNQWRDSSDWNKLEDRAWSERIAGQKARVEEYSKGERRHAEVMRSLVKYPLPAGLAVGTGIGALAALQRKRKAMKSRRLKRRKS